MSEITGFKPSADDTIGALVQIIGAQAKQISDLKASVEGLRGEIARAFKNIGHNF